MPITILKLCGAITGVPCRKCMALESELARDLHQHRTGLFGVRFQKKWRARTFCEAPHLREIGQGEIVVLEPMVLHAVLLPVNIVKIIQLRLHMRR